MTKIDAQIDQVAKTIMEIARSKGFVDLPSAADIEYGFGWEPTLAFWYGQRRIHLYGEEGTPEDVWTIEVAEEGSTQPVLLGQVTSYEKTWDILERFLRQRCSFDDLPDCGWHTSNADHNKFIPHPPSQAGWSMGNISSFVQDAKIHGKPWHPPDAANRLEKFKTWVSEMFKRFRG